MAAAAANKEPYTGRPMASNTASGNKSVRPMTADSTNANPAPAKKMTPPANARHQAIDHASDPIGPSALGAARSTASSVTIAAERMTTLRTEPLTFDMSGGTKWAK